MPPFALSFFRLPPPICLSKGDSKPLSSTHCGWRQSHATFLNGLLNLHDARYFMHAFDYLFLIYSRNSLEGIHSVQFARGGLFKSSCTPIGGHGLACRLKYINYLRSSWVAKLIRLVVLTTFMVVDMHSTFDGRLSCMMCVISPTPLFFSFLTSSGNLSKGVHSVQFPLGDIRAAPEFMPLQSK